MGWRGIRFVLICIFLAGCCGQSDIPARIWFDSKFDIEERRAVVLGMERWEQAAGLNFFEFAGSFNGEIDEFDFDDIGDGRHSIYKVETPTEVSIFFEEECLNRGQCPKELGLAGLGLHTDIALLWYNFGPQWDTNPEDRREFLLYLEGLATHESGHFLGLGHNNAPCDVSAMSPHSCFEHKITQIDVEQLCVFYDCP